MTITLTREEAQQVLDALDFHSDGDVQDLELMGMLRSRLKHSTHASDCAVYNEPAYPAGECDCTARLAQPEPEPVAWEYCGALFYNKEEVFAWHERGDISDTPPKPLYDAPPQREWQGLTAYEIQELHLDNTDWGNFACAIEAKLKEKNT